jgi:chromosome segregation ATPase
MRGGDPSMNPKTPSNTQPLRAKSAGKMRFNIAPGFANARHEEVDPTAMEQQILGLRERRESRRESPLRVRPDLTMSYSNTSHKKTAHKPVINRGLQALGSNLSEEELQAEERLKKAENKISGLVQELDELRFFQELESESPGPKTPKTPSRSRIPQSIRAVSPARGGRLPPPTKSTKNGGGGLETYKPLSPRKIAKLDRNSLELECQTLVRKLQLVDQEKQSQAAMIEMYEISMQEYDAGKKKTKKLEGELKKVSIELKRQLQNIQRGKESLMKEYEERIQNNMKKLNRIQEKAESYKADLDIAKKDAGKWKQDSESRIVELEDRKKLVNDLNAMKGVLEEQVNEARSLNTSLVKKVEKKRSEVNTLKEDLSLAGKAIEEGKEEKSQTEARIAALEQELAASTERNNSLEAECSEMKSAILKREETLKAASIKENDQAALIAESKKKIADLEVQCDVRFEEGKKATKAVENKRLQELVVGRAQETHEYERRIKAMQEQLRHQSDRHHAEIEETRKRNDENIELMREDVLDEIRRVEGDKAAKLESELRNVKRSLEQTKSDGNSRLKETQQRAREAASEFQYQEEARQQELDLMHDKLEDYMNEVSRKDDELGNLRDSFQNLKSKLTNEISSMRSKNESEMTKCKKLLEDDRKTAEKTKTDLLDELDVLKKDYSELDVQRSAETQSLTQQLDKANHQLALAETVAKENEVIKQNLSEVELTLDSIQSDLQSERSRNEEVESDLRVEMAKMEGRLRASESTLKTKRSQIHDLEKQLDIATRSHSKSGEEKESTIKLLRTRLEETSSRLERELTSAGEREATAYQLREEVAALQEKLTMMSRLEDTVKELKRNATAVEYEGSQKEGEFREMQRKIDILESEKIRKETELSNLRRDYQDLSGLLEENLHSSATKNGIGLEMRKREREMKETVDIYNTQFSDLEAKMTREIDVLQSKVKHLQSSLGNVKDEKIKVSSELSQLRIKYEMASDQLGVEDKQPESSKGRVDRHIRDVVQRYTRLIADLESKVEEEVQSRHELEDRLSSAREELDLKQNKTQELIQRHTKNAMKLDSDLNRSSMEQEELKIKLEQTTKDLEQKRKELKDIRSKYSNEFVNLKNVKLEQDEVSEVTRSELERKGRQLDEMKQKIPELLAELDAKTRERDQYRASSLKYEKELAKTVARYNDEISDLEAQLDEKSMAQSSTQGRAESARAEANRKDQRIKEMKKAVNELEALLETADKNKEASKLKAEAIGRELDDKQATLRDLEMEKIELESKVHTLSRSKDDLRSKVSDLSSRLERKEREVREVTDRYKMYVMELESKLDQDTDAKHKMQTEIDMLRSEVSDKLQAATREKAKIEEQMQTLTNEKSEVINALEGVINEVQNREDEIESLTEILERRDEELQHAKIIATKALQSAKDIQKRYKDKEKDRHADVAERMDELNDNVDVLTSKNDSLQRKISMLERDFRDRDLECKRLKDQLRHIDGKPLRENDHSRGNEDPASLTKAKDDGSTFTQSTFSSSRSRGYQNPTSNSSRSQQDPEGTADQDDGFGLVAESFSPSNSTQGFHGDTVGFEDGDEFPAFQTQPSEDYEESGAAGAGWGQDFDNESRGEYDSVASDAKSRRSIERDALRKYVRAKYAARS